MNICPTAIDESLLISTSPILLKESREENSLLGFVGGFEIAI